VVPGRCCCTCAIALFIMSMFTDASMSKSMCLMLKASMTCSYAAAWADALEQTEARYGPAAPPKDTATSPPSARRSLISPAIRESFSAMVPPQDGTQPADEPRTNASVKYFCPVAWATWARVGDDMVMSMYGQECAEPVPVPPPVCVVTVTLAECADSPAELVAETLNEE